MRETKTDIDESNDDVVDIDLEYQYFIMQLKPILFKLREDGPLGFDRVYRQISRKIWLLANQLPIYNEVDQKIYFRSLACGPAFLQYAIQQIEQPMQVTHLQQYVATQQSQVAVKQVVADIHDIIHKLITELHKYAHPNPLLAWYRHDEKIKIMKKLHTDVQAIVPTVSILQQIQSINNGLVETWNQLKQLEKTIHIEPGQADKIIEKYFNLIYNQMKKIKQDALFTVGLPSMLVGEQAQQLPDDWKPTEVDSCSAIMNDLNNFIATGAENASVKIQAQIRGYLVRKNLPVLREILLAGKQGDMKGILQVHKKAFGVALGGEPDVKEHETGGIFLAPKAVAVKPPYGSPTRSAPSSLSYERFSSSYEEQHAKSWGSFHTPPASDASDSGSSSASSSLRSVNRLKTTPERRGRKRTGVVSGKGGISQRLFAENAPKQASRPEPTKEEEFLVSHLTGNF
ncbi:MAG: hypothetical protein P1U40_11410 [Coxiellaceae bacterium]|nr:hypothetical protein [Coxiellaceae bacterium]